MNFEEWQTVQPTIVEKKEPRYLITVDPANKGKFGKGIARVVVYDNLTRKLVLEAKVTPKRLEKYLEHVKADYRKGGEGIRVIGIEEPNKKEKE